MIFTIMKFVPSSAALNYITLKKDIIIAVIYG